MFFSYNKKYNSSIEWRQLRYHCAVSEGSSTPHKTRHVITGVGGRRGRWFFLLISIIFMLENLSKAFMKVLTFHINFSVSEISFMTSRNYIQEVKQYWTNVCCSNILTNLGLTSIFSIRPICIVFMFKFWYQIEKNIENFSSFN